MTTTWEFADGWVLAAIATRHRRCSLVDVVASADMINHAILLADEVERALGKLTGAGLVRVYDDWTFELTDEGAEVWPGARRDLNAALDDVRRQLEELEPGTTVVRLPAGALEEAIGEYRRQAWDQS